MARQDDDTLTTDAADPQPPAAGGAQRVGQLGGTERELCMPGSGDPQDTQARGEAALSEVGVGPRLASSAFRVKEVTHVINATAHLMDLKLESNSLGDA